MKVGTTRCKMPHPNLPFVKDETYPVQVKTHKGFIHIYLTAADGTIIPDYEIYNRTGKSVGYFFERPVWEEK